MKIMILVAVLFITAAVASAQTMDVSKLPTIKVTGTAEINVVPDEVTFSLKVSKTDKSLVLAKQRNDENVGKILALAKQFNLNSTDVKTDFISVSEKFDRKKIAGTDDEYDNIFAGFTVSKTVVVKLRDLSKFESFFSEVVKIGITQISNVSFESSQLRKYKDQARSMAIRAAKEKAEAITKEIGQTIGKAVSIDEKDIDGYRSSYANTSRNSFSVSDDDSGDSETLSIGTISVKAQVEVEFVLN